MVAFNRVLDECQVHIYIHIHIHTYTYTHIHTHIHTHLDECQNEAYGDVQLCFLGLSLVPKDVEWFENEECDETRIRTVEPYEVEQRQMQLKEVRHN